MPGVQALLPRLVDAGVLLGIVSGALEAAAHIKLARGGLTRFFSFGGYGSDSRNRGELTRRAIDRAGQIRGQALDSRGVLVVGDTPRDVEAAHAAGAVAIGVATGKYTIEQLRAAGADYALAMLESPLPGIPELLAPASYAADPWRVHGTLGRQLMRLMPNKHGMMTMGGPSSPRSAERCYSR